MCYSPNIFFLNCAIEQILPIVDCSRVGLVGGKVKGMMRIRNMDTFQGSKSCIGCHII